MSTTGLIVIASAVLFQGGMMGTYIRLSRNVRKTRRPDRHVETSSPSS